MSAKVVERTDPPEELIGSGVLVAVAGPSGAGKDSVINYARERLVGRAEEVTFVRRSITRAVDLGAEDYEALDEETFERQRAEDAFAAYWHANGLTYGLPISMDKVLLGGGVVVANVSRAIIPGLRERYAHVLPVIITAPAVVLAERLKVRGRESGAEVVSRLERAEASQLVVDGAVVILNDGDLAIAGEKFLLALRKAAAWSDVGDTV